MRLPKYYCPHCKRFKRDNFLDLINGEYGTYCRSCLTDLIATENILLEIIEEWIKNGNIIVEEENIEHNRSI